MGKAFEWNKKVVAGADPKQAAKEVGYPNPSAAARQNTRSQALIERNRVQFEKIGLEYDDLYRTLAAGLSATKTRRESHPGGYIVYVEVPDHDVRLATVRQISGLLGLTPEKEGTKINVNIGDQNNLTINQGEVYRAINTLDTPEERIEAYNYMKKNNGKVPPTLRMISANPAPIGANEDME